MNPLRNSETFADNVVHLRREQRHHNATQSQVVVEMPDDLPFMSAEAGRALLVLMRSAAARRAERVLDQAEQVAS